MNLVDTSIWVDHLRAGIPRLAELRTDRQVSVHPWVIGELAPGRLSRREEVLELLGNLPVAVVATDVEVLDLMAARPLPDIGIGYVDGHLLAPP